MSRRLALAVVPLAALVEQVECVCGEAATVRVSVQWADGKRIYRYCPECADDIALFIEGAEVLP